MGLLRQRIAFEVPTANQLTRTQAEDFDLLVDFPDEKNEAQRWAKAMLAKWSPGIEPGQCSLYPCVRMQTLRGLS